VRPSDVENQGNPAVVIKEMNEKSASNYKQRDGKKNGQKRYQRACPFSYS
jgi:hypothetical protein